ncbi:hypothetical protein AB0L71_27505 [Streptomyces sp. NPDC052052]|uniref:hypothetical protein n=1 Tax=Streptomyces sp. NPDC052052 TaxID=3154756 RepID=UPI003419BEEB
MVGPNQNTEPTTGRLVIIDANVRTARIAHTLGYHTVFVQRPGTAVHELVDDFSGYYTVDFTGEEFTGFVAEVLRPLGPTAVVSLSDDGVLPAAVASSLLGTPGTPVDVVHRLTSAPSDDTDQADGGAPEQYAYTFSEAGSHRWVALVDEGGSPSSPDHVAPERRLPPAEHSAVETALTGFLDAAGLRNGPARVTLRIRDGVPRITGATPTAGTDDEAELVRRLTGVDLTHAALARALGLAAGHDTSPVRAQEGATR